MAWQAIAANPKTWAIAGSILKSAAPFFAQGGDRSNETKWAVTRRVRDARRAGVHPLYALGSAGSISPTMVAGAPYGASADALGTGLQDVAGYVERERAERAAASTPVSASEQRIREAQARSLEASAHRDETAAQLNIAEATRAYQDLAARGRDAAARGAVGDGPNIWAGSPMDPTVPRGGFDLAPMIQTSTPIGSRRLVNPEVYDDELTPTLMTIMQGWRNIWDWSLYGAEQAAQRARSFWKYSNPGPTYQD